MSSRGIALQFLVATGGGRLPATLKFDPGLNVITGASDTGKSWVVKCIDYLCGGQTPPKSVEESQGYTEVKLQFADSNGQVYTLVRSLRGGSAQLYEVPIEKISTAVASRALKAKHDAQDKDTISSLLLDLSGFGQPIVRKNQRNETVQLTFRSISHWFIVDEQNIIREGSPIYQEHREVNNTMLTSAFNFVLTGIDDSSLLAVYEPTSSPVEREAMLRVYDQLITELKVHLEGISELELKKGIATLDETLVAVTADLERAEKDIEVLRADRERLSSQVRVDESRLIALGELTRRFELLARHYESDGERLDFVSQGTHLIGQLEVSNCPLCGQELGKHTMDQLRSHGDTLIEDVQAACAVESGKLKRHLADLNQTRGALEGERRQLMERARALRAGISDIAVRLSKESKPLLLARRKKIETLIETRIESAEVRSNFARLLDLEKHRAVLMEEFPSPGPVAGKPRLDPSSLRVFCDVLQTLLHDWKYPGDQRVEFSDRDMDVVIGGKQRQTSGKGLRAITYSAFVIALLRFSRLKGRPHLGFVVLDSPLTTFRGADRKSDDEAPFEVQEAFFAELANLPGTHQVIIFENKEPAIPTRGRINYVHFTGDPGSGRAGFFPNSI